RSSSAFEMIAFSCAGSSASSCSAMPASYRSRAARRSVCRLWLRRQTAGMPRDRGPLAGDRFAELNAVMYRLVAPREQLAKARLAHLQGLRAHVLPIHLHHVIGDQDSRRFAPGESAQPSKSDVLSD